MSFLFPFLMPIGLHFCPTSGHTNTANFYFDHTFRNSEQQPVLEHVIWIGGRMCRLDSIALYYKQITTYYPVWWNPNQPKYSDTSAYPRLVFSTPKYDYFFSIIMFFVWERFARKISKKENIFWFLNDNGPRPDLVKICNFISTLKNFGHFERVQLVFAKVLSLLWPIFYAIGQILIVDNGM